jgi:hypothetical protein
LVNFCNPEDSHLYIMLLTGCSVRRA